MLERSAFVTGADRGLGAALVARLLSQGWRVIAGQYLPDWPELGALAARFPGALEIVPLDVGSSESVRAAALNMAAQLLHNQLRPEGYSLRVYHPGWIRSYIGGSKSTVGDLEPDEAAVPALNYFLQQRDDDDTLVMRDCQGHDWPW